MIKKLMQNTIIALNFYLFKKISTFLFRQKRMKNNERPTKAKIKRAVNANLKGRASIKFYRRLTVTCSEMPASF